METETQLLEQAAAELMLPRWRALAEGDVQEKAPGELVTVVDRAVEDWLAQQLTRLAPGSRVIGEEACAADPALLDGICEGEVWLLDPLDGTSNFIRGSADFGILLALLRDGETVAAWMHLPVAARSYAAQRGSGAFCNGERVRVRDAGDPLAGIVKTRFLPEGLKEDVVQRAAALREMQAGANCTAVDYPAIAAGATDFALYWRTLPWDHAAPALFLAEAGGHVARLDGRPYRPHDKAVGLLAAAGRGTWERCHGLLGLAGARITGA